MQNTSAAGLGWEKLYFCVSCPYFSSFPLLIYHLSHDRMYQAMYKHEQNECFFSEVVKMCSDRYNMISLAFSGCSSTGLLSARETEEVIPNAFSSILRVRHRR
jgi:hypothetical protein